MLPKFHLPRMYFALLLCIAKKLTLCCSDENGKTDNLTDYSVCISQALIKPCSAGLQAFRLDKKSACSKYCPHRFGTDRQKELLFRHHWLSSCKREQKHIQKTRVTYTNILRLPTEGRISTLQVWGHSVFLYYTSHSAWQRRKPLSLATSHIVHAACSATNTAFIPEVMDLEKAILKH